MRKFFIETWGCQMNVLDSERLAGLLLARGFEVASAVDDSDVILLNTCSVREKAEAKVYSELGRLQEWKRSRPGRVIGVTGCVAQQEGVRILERAPYVDFVLGTGSVEKVGEAIGRAVEWGRREAYLEFETDSPVYQFRQISHHSPFQAYVTAIEGCDMFCTFCVVPFTRGRERSRRLGEIVEEVRYLAARGYREVTLLGQTVNAYRDPDGQGEFADLLSAVARVEGISRVRFLTSHPRFVSDRLIDVMATHSNIGRYFHLPAQSGSDRILYRMKRRYTRQEYLDILARVRSRIPDIALSSDFIVGFPGESEEDFDGTLDLVRQAHFANLFAFRYSPRPGTAAARWGGDQQVLAGVAAARLERLFAVQKEIQQTQNRGLEGCRFEVLVESRGRRPGQWSGRTICNRIVNLRSSPAERPLKPGDYVTARIVRGNENSLLGVVEARG